MIHAIGHGGAPASGDSARSRPGYEHAYDLDRLRFDPTFEFACGRLPDSGAKAMLGRQCRANRASSLRSDRTIGDAPGEGP